MSQFPAIAITLGSIIVKKKLVVWNINKLTWAESIFVKQRNVQETNL